MYKNLVDLLHLTETTLRERFAPLFQRLDKTARTTLSREIKALVSAVELDFLRIHQIETLRRIILSLYFLRRRARQETAKKLHIRLFPLTLHYMFGQKKAIGIALALETLNEYELFQERHIQKACSSVLPGSRVIPHSYTTITSKYDGTTAIYVEVEPSIEQDISRFEFPLLTLRLESVFEASIEPTECKLTIPINDEALLKQALLLSHQLKYLDDTPQAFVDFVQQKGEWLEFCAVVVRFIPQNQQLSPVKAELPVASDLARCTLRSSSTLNQTKKQHIKQVITFTIEASRKPFIRHDHSIDVLKARHFVLQLIADHFGTTRDSNGGLLTLHNQQLEHARLEIDPHELQHSRMLDEIFYNLQPHVMRSLITPQLLVELFRRCIAYLDSALSINIEKTAKGHTIALFHDQQSDQQSDQPSNQQSPPPEDLLSLMQACSINEQASAFTSCIYRQQKLACLLFFDTTDEQHLSIKSHIQSLFLNSSQLHASRKAIRISLTRPTRLLDPRIATDRTSGIVIKHLYEGLLRHGPDGAPQKALAEEITLSSDKKTYTFRLRKSFWSNGTPLTAYDFEYAWKQTLLPSFHSLHAYLLFPIKNAPEAKQGLVPISSVGVQAIDENTLVVELSRPIPCFLDLCSHWVYSPLSKEIDQKQPGWAYYSDRDYVCNGPFRLHQWKKNTEIILVRNERFWDATTVHPDEILIKIIDDPKLAFDLFRQGKLDVIGEPLSEIPFEILQNRHLYNIYTKDVSAIQWYTLNTQKAPFGSEKCRQAISLAIDRNKLAAETLFGFEKPSTSLLATTLSMINDIPIAYDIGTARQLFQAGLEEQGLELCPPLSIRVYNQEPYRNIASKVADMLYHALNIHVTVEIVSWETFFNELPRREHDILGITWYSWYQDPLYTFEIFTNPSHEMNGAGWTDLVYQELVQKLRAESKNDALVKQIELYLLEKMPVVPLVGHTFRYMKSQRIENISLSHLGNIDFRWTKLYNL